MGEARTGGVGQQLLLLVVLLGLLAGYGAWNYQRNLALEQREVRPFRTLSDDDLALLVAATEAEAGALSRAYEAVRGRRAAGGGDRWERFENAQAQSRRVRDLGHRASEHEASLAEMRREQARRKGAGSEWSVLLRRIFVYSTG